jgi:hypothetical protein
MEDTNRLQAKQAAAIAGVLEYLKSESEAHLCLQKAALSGRSSGAWALHGRQTIMHMRGLVQRRVLKR